MLFEVCAVFLAAIPVMMYFTISKFEQVVNRLFFIATNLHVILIEAIAMWPPAPTYGRYRSIIEISKIKNCDGTSSYFGKWGNGRKVLFWLHGNAMNIGEDSFYRMLADRLGVTIIAPEYHGYCPDTYKVQRPTFKKSISNCLSVYMHITRVLNIPESDIIVVGHSLGTGLALKMVSDHFCNPSKLVLISPFLSLMSVAHYLLAVFLQPFDQLKSYNEIAKVKQPTMIVHGTADTLIKIEHGYELYNRIPEYRRGGMLVLDGGTHNTMFSCNASRFLFEKMNQFIHD